jgi:hypothetical protein
MEISVRLTDLHQLNRQNQPAPALIAVQITRFWLSFNNLTNAPAQKSLIPELECRSSVRERCRLDVSFLRIFSDLYGIAFDHPIIYIVIVDRPQLAFNLRELVGKDRLLGEQLLAAL